MQGSLWRVDPLQVLSKHDLEEWTERVINNIPSGIPARDHQPSLPFIRAGDPQEGGRILVFVVQWLFSHGVPSMGPITRELRSVFVEDFDREFLSENAGCRLVPLSELLRYSRYLYLEM